MYTSQNNKIITKSRITINKALGIIKRPRKVSITNKSIIRQAVLKKFNIKSQNI